MRWPDDRGMNPPAADIALDEALVDRLVRAQHPDLAGPITLVANGWDNSIYRLGDDLCVRLPRRTVAAELVRNEQRWLPVLAERVHVPIPVPVRVGEPSPDYPWAWTIGRWFRGEAAVDVPPGYRGALAAALAEFMAELHVPAPAEAPANPVRGVPLASRTPAVHERLASGTIPQADELRAAWDRLSATPPYSGPPLWLHGDPHPANLLVEHDSRTAEARLAAVLDFGDLTAGDPATDLAAAWLVFDAEGRAAFRGHVDGLMSTDEDMWARARGWALLMGSAIVMHADLHPRLATVGRHTLDQVLAAT